MIRDITKYEIINIDDLNLPIRYKNALFILINKLIDLKDELEINCLFLFGSCSKGDIRQGSDIDILLLTNSEDEKKIRCKIIHEEINDTPILNIDPQVTVRNINRYLNARDNIKFHDIIFKDLKLLWRCYNE